MDYLAAARTADGGTVVAYMPTSRQISVELSKMSGTRVRVWWFDPRTGKAKLAGEFPTRGTRDFTPPGAEDWVLVLDDASKNLAPPGQLVH